MEEKKNKPIGALWLKENQYGQFYTGQFELNGQKINIAVFPNQFKKLDKHPDLSIFLSKTQPEGQPVAPLIGAPATPNTGGTNAVDSVPDSGIPFDQAPPVDGAPGMRDDMGLTPADYASI